MTILIAGAGRGIGKYLAQELSLQGNIIRGTYNSSDPYDLPNVTLAKVDVTDEAQVNGWIESISLSREREVVLINCVGVNYNSILHKSDTDEWMKVVSTNVKSAYLLMKHTLPIMRNQRFGRIILLSSVVPIVGVVGTSAYSASKSALWGLAKSASVENANLGITINTLNLGYFNIGMIKDVPENILSDIRTRIPMGKLGDPEDILLAVNCLMSSVYITGSQIDINGGLA